MGTGPQGCVDAPPGVENMRRREFVLTLQQSNVQPGDDAERTRANMLEGKKTIRSMQLADSERAFVYMDVENALAHAMQCCC